MNVSLCLLVDVEVVMEGFGTCGKVNQAAEEDPLSGEDLGCKAHSANKGEQPQF